VTMERRLERLEASTTNVSADPTLCFYCQETYHQAYRRDVHVARLIRTAEGTFDLRRLICGGQRLQPYEMTSDRARAALQEMLAQAPAELDHCRTCGELMQTGWLRELRADLGLA
jgi:hypothetical protein